jgi:hypothetical protein
VASNSSGNNIVTEMTQLVRGSIDEVMNDPNTGYTRVRINLGSNDRVSKNTRLYIIRDNTMYLGDMIIESVDLNHAVGRIAFVKDNQAIRAGDQVLSRLGS